MLHNKLQMLPTVRPVATGGIERLLMTIGDRGYRLVAKSMDSVGQNIIELMLGLRFDVHKLTENPSGRRTSNAGL